MTVSLISPVARKAAHWLKGHLPVRARLSSDSRNLGAGDVFVAYPGETSDGRAYIEEAISAGAAAVVLEQSGVEAFADAIQHVALPLYEVERLRLRAGELAAVYLDEPSARMTVVAVTGTNGKTSCTHWIAQGYNNRAVASGTGGSLAGAGDATARAATAAVIGTLGAGVPDEIDGSNTPAFIAQAGPAGHSGQAGQSVQIRQPLLTTPDGLGLQQQFATFVEEGIELVALEASSIGLQQGRLNGTRIAVAVLTNLTRDHLDYHVTMQAYAAAKARLFAWPTLQAMVVNLEDPASAEMLNAADPDLRRIGYLINDEAEGSNESLSDAGERSTSCSELITATPIDAQGRIVLSHFLAADEAFDSAVAHEIHQDGEGGEDGEIDQDGEGGEGSRRGRAGSVDLQLSLIGRFNLSNVLAVAGVWIALGWSVAEVAAQLEELRPVPGRLQLVGDLADQALPLAVVDYAHTPDAIGNALRALRPLVESRGGRLWCVFGAGGNRDAGKRPAMGAAAERDADVLVLTSDNPRDEVPEAIIGQLRAGLSRAPRLIEVDRARAIDAALQAADPADVVLIAGKGHESCQEIGGKRLPFSDVEQARQALERRASGAQTADGEPDPGGADV